jgi:hypothetical protein
LNAARPAHSSALILNYANLTSLEMISHDHIHLDPLLPSLRVLLLIMPFANCDCKNTLSRLETFVVDTGSNVLILPWPILHLVVEMLGCSLRNGMVIGTLG